MHADIVIIIRFLSAFKTLQKFRKWNFTKDTFCHGRFKNGHIIIGFWQFCDWGRPQVAEVAITPDAISPGDRRCHHPRWEKLPSPLVTEVAITPVTDVAITPGDRRCHHPGDRRCHHPWWQKLPSPLVTEVAITPVTDVAITPGDRSCHHPWWQKLPLQFHVYKVNFHFLYYSNIIHSLIFLPEIFLRMRNFFLNMSIMISHIFVVC
jgi:hypothetical protein